MLYYKCLSSCIDSEYFVWYPVCIPETPTCTCGLTYDLQIDTDPSPSAS